MIAVERETCALGVSAEGRHGLLFFVGGDLYDAILDDLRGEEAAIAILGWELSDVETLAISEPPPRSIHSPLTFLLLEAMRRRDESERDELDFDGLDFAEIPAAPGPATLIQALTARLDGLTGACLVDFVTGLLFEERFDTFSDLDPAAVAQAAQDLARAHLDMIAGLGIGSPPEEVVVTCDNLLFFILFVRPGRLLVLVADPARVCIPAIRAALHGLGPAYAGDLEPWPA